MNCYKVYARVGDTEQVLALSHPGLDYMVMQSERKSASGVASANGIWVEPEISVSVLQKLVTEKRREVETGGLTLPTGVRVATGIDDQNRITSVIANAELAGVEVVDFKAASGWVSITISELKSVAAAIVLHVQQCFTVERIHHEAIDAIAAQYTADPVSLEAALVAYDTTQGWPSTSL